MKDELTGAHPAPQPPQAPELALASNPLRHLQFGVKVVVGTAHLSNTDPVLPFERQLQWTPAQAGGQIHDEAHDISESNGTDIPAEEKRCRVPWLSQLATYLPCIPCVPGLFKSSLGQITCACPTKQLHSLWSEVLP